MRSARVERGVFPDGTATARNRDDQGKRRERVRWDHQRTRREQDRTERKEHAPEHVLLQPGRGERGRHDVRPAARPASRNSRILTRHSSRLRTHQAIPATTISRATTIRRTVPTSGCSRAATMASPDHGADDERIEQPDRRREAGELRRHGGRGGRRRRQRVGGVAHDADTAPDTPTQVTGTHSASAPAHASGSRRSRWPPRGARTAPARRPARRGGGPSASRVGRGTPSVWSGWSISCDSGSTASRPSRYRATPTPTIAGVVPRSTATAAIPATIARARHAGQAGDRVAQRPRQPRCQMALRRRPGEGRAEAEPRPAARLLAAQLAAQQDDRAQVLHGHGEAQLRDEVGRGARAVRRAGLPASRMAITLRATTTAMPMRSTGWPPHPPQGEAADRVDRARGSGRRWRSPGRRARAARTRSPASAAGAATWVMTATATNSAPIAAPATAPLAAHASPEPGQPARRQLAGDRRRRAPGEGHRPQPLHDRPGEDLAARDGGQQEVAHVRRLDRDRAAVAAAAQPEGDGERGAGADDRRSVVGHVGDLRRRRRVVGHEPAEPQRRRRRRRGRRGTRGRRPRTTPAIPRRRTRRVRRRS